MARLFNNLVNSRENVIFGLIRKNPQSLKRGANLHSSAATLCIANQSEEPFILKSKFEDVPLSKDPFGDFMWSNAQKYSSRTALVRIIQLFLIMNRNA